MAQSKRRIPNSHYPSDCGPLLDGALLCGDFSLNDDIVESRHADRPCWHFTATRQNRRTILHGFLEPFAGNSLEVWVDQETGALLRCIGSHIMRIFELNISRFEPNIDIDFAIFEERAPEGLPGPGPVDLGPKFADIVATGPPPDDEENARLEARNACENVFVLSDDESSMPFVERGEDLGHISVKARKLFGASERTPVRVSRLKFVHSAEAVADLVIEHTTSEFPTTARVLVIDGVWKVERAFIAKIYGMAGIFLPE